MSQSAVYTSLIERIDFDDHELWPDEKIGKYLVAVRIGAEAEIRGIPANQIPKGLAVLWVEKMAQQEAGDVGDLGLEKAIHLAATGHFKKSGAILRAWVKQSAVNVGALDEAISGRRKQQAIAKKPRPRKAPTARSETIAAMRPWRSEGSSLSDFLDAAGVGSIEGVSITQKPLRGVKRFCVECSAVAEQDQLVAPSTLEGWWRDADK